MGKGKKNFWTWIQSPEVGRYSGRITTGIFAIMILTIAAFVRVGIVNAGATNGVNLNDDGVNEVRMTSVDYVFTYDSSVDVELKEAVRDYIYASVDSVKLLHMVNMRQHVVFTNETEIRISDDGTTVYMPISSSSDSLWATLDLLD